MLCSWQGQGTGYCEEIKLNEIIWANEEKKKKNYKHGWSKNDEFNLTEMATDELKT